MVRLSECPDRSHNLQLLRFIAAVMVIVGHAFPLSTGNSEGDVLLYLTNGQLSLGGMAVSIFFCAGGYLICGSAQRTGNAKHFLGARIRRLFPLLFVVTFLSAFVMGPLATTLDSTTYFKSAQVYRYMLNAILVLQHNLPGVFTNNIYGSTVNGSLWTLPIEFLCYIVCFIMWRLHLLEEKRFLCSIPMIITGTIAIYWIAQYTGVNILVAAVRPALLFYMGMLFYSKRDSIGFSVKKELLCLTFLIISAPFSIFRLIWIICFPYILFYCCFVLRQIPEQVGRLGELSYGIYLCAYPIQQIVIQANGGNMNPFVNGAVSIALAIIGAVLLHIFIERPLMAQHRRLY